MRSLRSIALLFPLLLLGCAHGPSAGFNTATYGTWAGDCGVSRPFPNTLKRFRYKDFQRSDRTVIVADSDYPTGGVGIMSETECEGPGPGGAKVKKPYAAIRVVRLSMVREGEPSGENPVKAKLYRWEEVQPDHWND